MFFFYSRFNEALQGAQDKAEPGRMDFSAVSREASHPRRGIQQFYILVRTAAEEAILMAVNSGVSLGTECFPGGKKNTPLFLV